MKGVFLLMLLVCVSAVMVPISEARTQGEISELNSMENEWSSSIDKAVSCMRNKDRSGAGIYIKKANSVIGRMKELLIRKEDSVNSADKSVAMDKLTDAYKNMETIIDYVVDARTLVMNSSRVKAIISDTREKLLDAYVRFYEVPQLQDLCKRFVGVLDELEREMNKALSKVSL